MLSDLINAVTLYFVKIAKNSSCKHNKIANPQK